jgi:hypothetical protein
MHVEALPEAQLILQVMTLMQFVLIRRALRPSAVWEALMQEQYVEFGNHRHLSDMSVELETDLWGEVWTSVQEHFGHVRYARFANAWDGLPTLASQGSQATQESQASQGPKASQESQASQGPKASQESQASQGSKASQESQGAHRQGSKAKQLSPQAKKRPSTPGGQQGRSHIVMMLAAKSKMAAKTKLANQGTQVGNQQVAMATYQPSPYEITGLSAAIVKSHMLSWGEPATSKSTVF